MAFLDKEGLIRTIEHIKTHIANEIGKLTKADFGLSNVDNTSDADKPISTLQQNALNNKVDKISGKGLSTNDFTTDEKNKLSFISSGAEVNQNAYSNVIVNSTTLSAKTETDSLELVAGSNVTLTPDSSTNKITISSTGGGNNSTNLSDIALNKQTLGYSKKNLLKADFSSKTVNGVTYTVSNGSVTVKGTATANASVNTNEFILEKGTYIASGCPKGGTVNTYRISINNINDTEFSMGFDFGDGVEFTLTEKTKCKMYLDIRSGYTADNLTFYPMIRSADIEDDTYEPYVDDVQTQLNRKASTSVVTTSANGLMSSTDKTKLDNTNIAYGTCSTAAATANKVVTISGNTNWSLKVGSIIIVKFTVPNTASNVKLNVNNTGAKSIWYNNAVYTGNSDTVCGYANRYTTYMYDGTNWVWISNGVDNNTTTFNNYMQSSTTSNTYTSLADFWTYCDGLMKNSASKIICGRAGFNTFTPINAWGRYIASCQNHVGNGQWPVTGSIIIDNGNVVLYGRVNGGITNTSDLSIDWRILGGTDYSTTFYSSTEPTSPLTNRMVWIQ